MSFQTEWTATIHAAYASGRTEVRIDPGRYVLSPEGSAHWTIEDLDRPDDACLTVDMTGVELVCADNQTTAVMIRNCRNIVLQGAEIGYAVPTMSQGEVTAVSDDGRAVEVTLDEGYPSLTASRDKTAYVYHRDTRRMKNDTPDMYAIGAEHVSGRTWRLFYREDMRANNVCVGDVLGLRCEGAMAVIVNGCEHVMLRELTITDGCFAILESGGEGGNVYERISVYPKEKPEGAIHPRVLSTYADAFHSSCVRKGPTIRNCRFNGMGDDCVNIHGEYAYYAATGKDGELIYACHDSDVFDRAGDRIRFLNTKGVILHETRVRETLGLAEGFTLPEAAFAEANRRFRPGKYYRLILEDPFDPPFGARMANLDKGGNGFRLVDNFFGSNRARGVLIKASEGIVEGNVFSGQSIHAVLVSPEYYWNESCFVNGLVIRSNIFRGGGFVTGYRPAIVIEGEFGSEGGISHRNITIENNIFRDNNRESLLVSHAHDVHIRHNVFGARNAIARNRRVCPGHVRIQNAFDVTLEDNAAASDMPFVADGGNAEFVIR